MTITPQQKQFFATFGYLVLPGLVKEEIGWITEEFEAVFRDRGVVHDGTKRSVIVPFIDQRERLCTLLDHPAITGLIGGLLGDNFNYLGGDGNFYTGDTLWHSDGFHTVGTYLKVALYLDPVTINTGCLRDPRFPPHRFTLTPGMPARRDAAALWGIAQDQVPAVALESQPGDVVAFNHNLMHAAFGGNKRRRMFTMNNCAHCTTPAEIQELENFIAAKARFWVDHSHSEIMRNTASPQRMRYLQQVIDHEGHLPALSAKARLTMSEPARG